MSDLKSAIDDLRVEITLCHFHGLLIRDEPTFVHISLLRRYNTHGEAYLEEPVYFRFNYQSILVSTHGFPQEICLLYHTGLGIPLPFSQCFPPPLSQCFSPPLSLRFPPLRYLCAFIPPCLNASLVCYPSASLFFFCSASLHRCPRASLHHCPRASLPRCPSTSLPRFP